jgi:RNA polymerase sigma-70 factor (ECF subfamily)
MTETQVDFRDLMQRVREGSEEAAWELVGQYGDTLCRTIRRILDRRLRSKFDTLDFVQLVWGSLFRARDTLDRFDRPAQLGAYLAIMARNKVAMEARRRLQTEKYNVNREDPYDSAVVATRARTPDRQSAPIDVAIARERWDHLLKDQPPHYRQIICLRLQGHTHQAIADRLGLDESTVQRFLKRLLEETPT